MPHQGGGRRPGHTSRLDATAAAATRASSSGAALRKHPGAARGRENAPSYPFRSPRLQKQQQSQRRHHQQQQQEQQAAPPPPLARHYDAMLLHSLNAAVAAAGQSGSCWLDAASDGEEVSSAVQLPSPTAAGVHGQPPALLHTPASATSSHGQPGSPGLLLPHLQSARAEDCSWLMSSSPAARWVLPATACCRLSMGVPCRDGCQRTRMCRLTALPCCGALLPLQPRPR